MTNITRSRATGNQPAYLMLFGGITAAWIVWHVAAALDAVAAQPDGASAPLSWGTLVRVAALMVAALGAVLARAGLARELRSAAVGDPMSRALFRATSITLASTVVVTALTALVVFFMGFGFNASTTAANRFVNLYLPILGLTINAVFALIGLFTVRAPRAERNVAAAEAPSSTENPSTSVASVSNSLLAMAFAIPVVASAIGLTTGLFVFDLTKQAPEAAVWVLILAWIGAGITAGTLVAARSEQGVTRESDGYGAVRAARYLNAVLSVVFVAVTLVMSLAYGANAVSKLNMSSSLSASAFGDKSNGIHLVVDGTQLNPGAPVEVSVSPGTSQDLSGSVNGDGMYYHDTVVSPPLTEGEYTISASTVARNGAELRATTVFTVDGQGMVQSNGGQPAVVNALISIDGQWLLREFGPAIAMLVLAEAVWILTLRLRNSQKSHRASSGNVVHPQGLEP